MSQLLRSLAILVILAGAAVAHPGAINVYVNPANNQLLPFEPFAPGVFDLFPGIEISAPFPGFGVSSTSNGVAAGARLELSTTLGLLHWDGTDIAPTDARLTIEAPTFDNDGEENDTPVTFYEVTHNATNLTGMIWGTYGGTVGWEADGLYLLNPLSAPTGIYGLAVRLDAPEHEISRPFLFPFVFDPNGEWEPAQEDAGITRLRQTVWADVNFDGLHDCTDINLLIDDIVSERNTPEYDFTQDGTVDEADLATWLEVAGRATVGGPYLPGDANLDGHVDEADYQVWHSNRFTRQSAWCVGDFDADGFVDGSDLLIWNAHKFTSSLPASTVPEPAGGFFVAILAAIFLRRFRA